VTRRDAVPAGHGRVGGLDGCRAGWVLATIAVDPAVRDLDVAVVATFAEAFALVEAATIAALAVDMPIGLPDREPRTADRDARARLGSRRSTVFPTPVRSTVAARDYPDALARSRRASGRGLSKQAYHLLPRIREVDRLVRPADQDRVFECHPELAFAGLTGQPIERSKHTPEGLRARIGQLELHLSRVADAVEHPPPGARPDDVADALAIALVARRFVTGDVEVLGDGAVDRRGLHMQIVC
jgi:predicted RNase H-like nuclease